MSYKIMAMVAGMQKPDVIENGVMVMKVLNRGDIVEVNQVYRSELEDGYYKIVTSSPIVRSRDNPPANTVQAKILEDLISSMQGVLKSATAVLSSIQQHPVPVKVEAVEPVAAHPALWDGNGDIPKEFTVSEGVACAEIYDENKFKQSNKAYQNVLFNTVNHGLVGPLSKGREIRTSCNFENKTMPTISEARLGPVDMEMVNLVLDKNGKQSNIGIQDMVPAAVVDDRGNVDVIKTLGICMTNKVQD